MCSNKTYSVNDQVNLSKTESTCTDKLSGHPNEPPGKMMWLKIQVTVEILGLEFVQIEKLSYLICFE